MKRSVPNYFKILFALLIMGWSSGVYAQVPIAYLGSGTLADPFVISTINNLRYLSENTTNWGDGSYFVQDADIDASATSTWNPGPGPGFIPAGFSPIGNSSTPFAGYYDGQNHTISNLYIDRPATNDIGLFGYTDAIIINNLGLLDVSITGNNDVGAIGGAVYQADNCYSTGSLTGTNYVGGIGGLMGFGNNCYSTCNITGTDYVGGLCGYNVGGIYNCYSNGNVTGNQYVGGLVGYNDAAVIQFCYSTGSVTGTTDVGGLVGLNNFGSADDCFWNTETSGQATSDGGTGRTTAEMTRVGTYLSDPTLFLSWDFNLSSFIWGYNGIDNGGYPFLRFEGLIPGDVWLGAISFDWTDLSNWSEDPGFSGVNVFIPDVPIVANDPVIITGVALTKLTIETGGVLTLGSTGQLTVSGTLTNGAGEPGLILESGTSGASLVNSSANVSGTVQRDITPDNRWHLLSCPIIQTPMPQICNGNFAPLTGDFDATTGATYDFFYWQEPPASGNLNWINLKKTDWSPNTADFGAPPRFVKGIGYLVEYGSAFTGDPNKTFTGTLGVGSIVIPVTNTPGGSWSSFNLIGNTYPSSIDWKASSGWDRTPLQDNGGGKDFWMWNETAGNYGVYNSALAGDAGTNGVSRYIPPMQGFFVQSATGGGNVIMADPVRCHSTQDWLKTVDNTLRIVVTSTINTYSDEVLLAFNSIVNGGSDKFFSLYDEAPSLYLPVDNNKYSIRFIDELSSTPAIPVSFKAGKDGNYRIDINGTDIFSNVYLQDLKTGMMQDVKVQPAYSFTSSTTDDATRFMLRFTPLGIDPKQSGHDNIFIYNNILTVNDPGSSVITIYNMMGTKILEKQSDNEPLYQLPLQLPTGYYLVKVTNGKMIYTQKVFVK